MEYFKNLVCPYTKQALELRNNYLVTKDKTRKYPIISNIPCFVEEKDIIIWNEYHENIYSDVPNPPHPYYKKFAEDWEIMLDLGCGDGAMSAGCSYKVKHIYCVDPSLRALKTLQKRGIQIMYPIVAKGEIYLLVTIFLTVYLIFLLLNI